MVYDRLFIRIRSFLGNDLVKITNLKFYKQRIGGTEMFFRDGSDSIKSTTLATLEGKSIFQLDFQKDIVIVGRNLSKTPNLYYVKSGCFILMDNNTETTVKESDTFTIGQDQSYTIKCVNEGSLLEFESSTPKFFRPVGPAIETAKINGDEKGHTCDEKPLWVQRRKVGTI